MLPTLRNENRFPTIFGAATRLPSLFDRFFNEDMFTPTSWTRLPLSMREDEQNVYVEADVPGLTDKDVEVSVYGDDLIIKGQRKCECKDGGYDTRTYGQFEQRVSLPMPVDADKVEAKMANGVLHLTLPKSEAAKARRIAVTSE